VCIAGSVDVRVVDIRVGGLYLIRLRTLVPGFLETYSKQWTSGTSHLKISFLVFEPRDLLSVLETSSYEASYVATWNCPYGYRRGIQGIWMR